MAAGALLEIGQGGLAADHHRAGVDLVHQVEALGIQVLDAREADGAGVVDQGIDAAEVRSGLGHGLTHRVLVAHVQLQGQGLAAGRFHFLRHAEDGARELGMGLGALGGDDDVGAIGGGVQGDLAADAAAGAGDEQGFAGKGHCVAPVCFSGLRAGS
ncbi:hypothetical protein D9M70_526480 [compost metagenome]